MNTPEIIKERNEMISDLEKTFKMALEAGDYKAAIHAKQIIAKMKGFIESKKQSLSLMELSAQELEALIIEAENLNKWHHS